MINNELIKELKSYGLTVILKDRDYCLMEIEGNECYENMSITCIEELLLAWKKHNNYISIDK